MAIHPADRRAANPRLQCIVCGQWKRLHGRDKDGNVVQRFYGGCTYSNGDHLFRIDGSDPDVCHACCLIACRDIAIGRAAG